MLKFSGILTCFLGCAAYNGGMKQLPQNFSKIAAYRAEGRTDDAFWPAMTWKQFDTPEDLDAALTRAAEGITHPGYDKFDIEVTAWGGRVGWSARWDLMASERVEGAVRRILGWCGIS